MGTTGEMEIFSDSAEEGEHAPLSEGLGEVAVRRVGSVLP